MKALECQGVLLDLELSLKAWASRKFEFKSGNGNAISPPSGTTVLWV